MELAKQLSILGDASRLEQLAFIRTHPGATLQDMLDALATRDQSPYGPDALKFRRSLTQMEAIGVIYRETEGRAYTYFFSDAVWKQLVVALQLLSG
jgi:predicted transcriptional regulator